MSAANAVTCARAPFTRSSSARYRAVELRPDNPDFKPMRMRRADGEIRVIAEFLEVVG
jgi:hypothetical protein